MKCQDIMKSEVECVAPDETVQIAAARMRDEGIGFLPVCDPVRTVLGTLTDRDIAVRAVADGLAPSTPVGDVMSRELVACRDTDTLRTAERLMAQNHKSRIMCLDEDGRLVGVISLSDIAEVERGAQAARVLREIVEREVRV